MAATAIYGLTPTIRYANLEAAVLVPNPRLSSWKLTSSDPQHTTQLFWKRLVKKGRAVWRKVKSTAQRKFPKCPMPKYRGSYKPRVSSSCRTSLAQTAFLSIRGTDSLRDWITNLKMYRVPCRGKVRNCNGRVHIGYINAVRNMRRSVAAALGRLRRQRRGLRKVVVVGHSLGGAVAMLTALDLVNSRVMRGLKMSVVTLGAPRFAGHTSARGFQRYFGGKSKAVVSEFPLATCNCKRFKYMNDVVVGGLAKLNHHIYNRRDVLHVPCINIGKNGVRRASRYSWRRKCQSKIEAGQSLGRIRPCHSPQRYTVSVCKYLGGVRNHKSACNLDFNMIDRHYYCKYTKKVVVSDTRRRQRCERPAMPFNKI